MLRTASCSASLTSASPFFRHFPLSYSSLSSSTGALRAPGRNLRRVASPSSTGRRVFLRRGLRVPSTAVRGVNRQLSRLSVRAVATQPAPSYPGKDSHFILSLVVGWLNYLASQLTLSLQNIWSCLVCFVSLVKLKVSPL